MPATLETLPDSRPKEDIQPDCDNKTNKKGVPYQISYHNATVSTAANNNN